MNSSGTGDPQAGNPRRHTAALSRAAAVNAIAGIILCFAAAVVLLVHGSVYAVAFFAIGIFYLTWFSGVQSRNERMILSGFMLVGLFFILWAVLNAAAYHRYHYALAVAAYGLWAFLMGILRVASRVSSRTAIIMVMGHMLALLGFLFVDLSWQVDTAAALTSITVTLIGALSLGFDMDKVKQGEEAQA